MVTESNLAQPGPRIVFVNRAFTAMTGYAPEEILGKTPRVLYGAKTDHRLFTRLLDDLERHRKFVGEGIFCRKDGSEFVLEWQIIPLLDTGGRPRFWLSIQRDASRWKDAERDRHAAEEMYRQLVENQPDLICRFLPDTTLTFVNAAYADFFRREPEDLVGRRFVELLSEEDADQVFENLASVTPETPRRQYEHKTKGPDGHTYWHVWSDLATFDEKGNVLLFQSVGTDITERKKAEDALRDSEALIRTIADGIPSQIAYVDQDHKFRFNNKAYEHWFGMAKEECYGKPVAEVVGKDNYERIKPYMERALGGERVRFEYISSFEGRDRLADVTYIPDVDANGKVRGFYGLVNDLTERKKTEDALRESEKRIRTITDSLPSRIAYLDTDFRYRFNNRAYETCFGMRRENIYGKHLREIIGEKAFEQVKDYTQRALGGERMRYEFVNNYGEDQKVEEVIYVPDLDADGTPKGIYVLITDITERKRVENETRASKEFLDNVLDAIDDPVFVKDEDHRWVVLNAKACALAGGSRPELIGKSDFDCFNDEQARFHWDMDDQALNSSRPLEYKEQIRFEGRIRTFLTKKGRFVDSSTGRRYIAGMTRDITELAQVQEALLKEKERAEVTLHAITDAVVTTDANGRVEYMNPVAEALTGWTIEDARGRPLSMVCQLIDEQTRKPAPDLVAACLAAGNTVSAADHSIVVGRAGRESAVEGSAAPIRARGTEVPGVVLVFHDVTDTRRMAKKLAHDAAHDPLTLLVNRREFERRLERELKSAKQYGSRHALCYIDLDQFKIVNDTAGHAAGDELLKQVRGLLAGKFRERDTLARLGGDEFALLLDNCALEEAIRLSEIIVSTFREYRFEWQGRTFQVGASIGLVPVTAEAESTAQLLAQADVACYTAKDLGRSRVHVYQGEAGAPSLRHSEIHLAANLRDALEQERFCLHYQPIVPLSGRAGPEVRFEVLLRMLNTDGTLLPPRAFIPAAERFGLMPAIDQWVIRMAFRRYRKQFAHIPGAEIAINLSGTSLSDDSLLQYVREQFEIFSVPPANVCFEITETAAIQNLGHAIEFITAVKKAGSRLALDDFGSGLSSFKYLKTLPADYLKIDGSFVQDMLDNPVDHAMVEAINEVGHIMGIKTIAEYVHNRAIMDRLTVIGVDCAQGFAIGEPVPLN